MMNSVWFNVEHYHNTHSTQYRCTHYTLRSPDRIFLSVCSSVTSWCVILFSTNSSPLIHPLVHFPPYRTRANPPTPHGLFREMPTVQIQQHILLCRWKINFSLTYQLTNSVAPASEDLSQFSQQTATSPYTEPNESTLNPLAKLANIHFDPIFSTMPPTSDATIFHGLSYHNLVHFSLLSHDPPIPYSTIWSA
jgi:hypothetical protein